MFVKKHIIKTIKAREILDSRGIPTIESELITNDGIFSASIPSGTSTGKDEAIELRDGGKRYGGKGVLKAIKNIEEIICPKLRGIKVLDQEKIDECLINLDGTENKSALGANAILAVSMAVARAGAATENLHLWQYLSGLSGTNPSLPIPSMLCIEGSLHAGNNLDIQEFMIAPKADSFKERLRMGTEIYHTLESIIKQKYSKNFSNVGKEGGFTPSLANTEQVLDLILEAIREVGYDSRTTLAMDVAASSFYKNGDYAFEGEHLNSKQLLEFYTRLVKKYSFESIEDPFDEGDWKSFTDITAELGEKIFIVGDDLLVTNMEKIKKAVVEKSCNGLLLKLNQIGTVTEAVKAGQYALENSWRVMVSHRSGETCDSFIADLAVGLGCGWIKTGAPARGERTAKYNRLLQIEEEMELKKDVNG